jgi:hypothetical protein
MSKKPSDEKRPIVPDPDKKTYIDEEGRKYWLATGYHGRVIKVYGEPWKFRTTLAGVIVQLIILGVVLFAIYRAIFGK